MRTHGRLATLSVVAFTLTCSDPTGAEGGRAIDVLDPATCDLDLSLVADGGVSRDGIPALVNPPLTDPEAPDALYVLPDDWVIGIEVGDEAIAVPHRILWHHEIVNLELPEVSLAITYCPLTGSALVFDRSSIGGDEFGVSGLLYMNNLLMYNRRTNESLWPQMLGKARCGENVGAVLTRYPSLEGTWTAWRTLHPNTRVVSSDANLSRDYAKNPYQGYEEPNSPFAFPMPRDSRRLPKERVLGIPESNGPGVVLPLLALRSLGRWAVVTLEVEGTPVVVFYDANTRTAAAYRQHLDGETLDFRATPTGIFDDGTNTRWLVNGRAHEGPNAGRRLEPVHQAFIAYWGAWAAFFPQSILWEPMNTGTPQPDH